METNIPPIEYNDIKALFPATTDKEYLTNQTHELNYYIDVYTTRINQAFQQENDYVLLEKTRKSIEKSINNLKQIRANMNIETLIDDFINNGETLLNCLPTKKPRKNQILKNELGHLFELVFMSIEKDFPRLKWHTDKVDTNKVVFFDLCLLLSDKITSKLDSMNPVNLDDCTIRTYIRDVSKKNRGLMKQAWQNLGSKASLNQLWEELSNLKNNTFPTKKP